jgi:hypothetical protein
MAWWVTGMGGGVQIIDLLLKDTQILISGQRVSLVSNFTKGSIMSCMLNWSPLSIWGQTVTLKSGINYGTNVKNGSKVTLGLQVNL